MTHEKKTPVVVCLSGSTRFKDAFEYIRAKMTMNGSIVIGPEVFPGGASYDLDIADTAESVENAKALQMRKIDMADALFVVNPGNFIEGTTKEEIAYAESLGKPVYYHEEWYTPEYLGDDTFWQATNYPLPENCVAVV